MPTAPAITAAAAQRGKGFLSRFVKSAHITSAAKAADASANFYNNATLSDMTGTVVTVGFVTEHPTADTYIDGHSGRKMDPGCFMLPHRHVAQPLP